MVSVVVGITGTPATDPALAVHGPDWTPWATTTITVAYNAHITVTWTHDSDGTTITKTCVLVQGYNDESGQCVSGPLPGSPFTALFGYSVTSHSIAWHDPLTFTLTTCDPTGALIDASDHQFPSGAPCASPPDTTTTTTTTTLPPDCEPGEHSHTGDGVGCHPHDEPVDPVCGEAYQTINGVGHDEHVVNSVPPCPTTTTTTTLPPCPDGEHSHTGDGVDCHPHPVPPNPVCGEAYQTINGSGHANHIVTSVPPCEPQQTDCSSGLHSHTGDGVGCHPHNYTPSTCGATYWRINGVGHTTHTVTAVPPCPTVTPTPTFTGTGTCVPANRTWTATWTNGSSTPTVEIRRQSGATALAVLNDGDTDVAGRRGETYTLNGQTLTVALPYWHWYNTAITDYFAPYHADAPKNVRVGTTEIIGNLSALIKTTCQPRVPG